MGWKYKVTYILIRENSSHQCEQQMCTKLKSRIWPGAYHKLSVNILYCWLGTLLLQSPSLSGRLCPSLGSVLFLPFVSLPLPDFVGLSSFLPFAFHSLQKLTVPIPVGFIPTLLPIPSAKIMSKETATMHINLGLDTSRINTWWHRNGNSSYAYRLHRTGYFKCIYGSLYLQPLSLLISPLHFFC